MTVRRDGEIVFRGGRQGTPKDLKSPTVKPPLEAPSPLVLGEYLITGPTVRIYLALADDDRGELDSTEMEETSGHLQGPIGQQRMSIARAAHQQATKLAFSEARSQNTPVKELAAGCKVAIQATSREKLARFLAEIA